MKISESTIRKIIREQINDMLTEIKSDTDIFQMVDEIASEIENDGPEDESVNPYEEIVIELIKYFPNEDMEEAIKIVGSSYGLEYDELRRDEE